MTGLSKNIKKNEVKIIKALYRLLTNVGKLTIDRAAQDENIPVHYLLKYSNEQNIPMVTIEDSHESLPKVLDLMRRNNIPL